MNLIQASDGHHNLFVWREGAEYYRQKSDVFLNEFTTLIYELSPQPPGSPMIYHDVTKPLPFADNSFDHVYCYHVYEHLLHKEADFFTAEISRILKRGGIYRVSTPDMEMVAGEYLKYLENSLMDPSEVNLKRYRWCVMKLIEQSIRGHAGGLMLESMRSGEFDRDYVKDTFGESYAVFFDAKPQQESRTKPTTQKSFLSRLLSLNPSKIKRRIDQLNHQRKLRAYRNGPGADLRFNRETVTLLPDRFYLKLKLEKQGFIDFAVKDYKTSDIPHWDKYDLDRSNHGDYAYDVSVYVEARKKRT